MTYKLLYMEDVVVLYNKLNSKGKIPEGLKIKMSLNGDTYLFKGGLDARLWWRRFPLYNQDGSLYLNVKCESLYVCEDYIQ